MRGKKAAFGYTIVEVMIVLAISGVMFIIAANFINGKQERAAFTQGSNDLVSQLQSMIEDVTDGHYSDVSIGSLPCANSGISGQGTNSGCVFVGKIIHFYGTGGQANNYNVFSLAAAQSSFGSVSTVPVYAIPGLTTKSTISQSLYITSISVTPTADINHPDTTAYNLGFAQGLGTANGADIADGYEPGAQTISLVYATGLNGTNPGAETDIAGPTVQLAQSATICLTDGVRYANILIGGNTASNSNNSNQLSITAQQLGTTPCH